MGVELTLCQDPMAGSPPLLVPQGTINLQHAVNSTVVIHQYNGYPATLCVNPPPQPQHSTVPQKESDEHPGSQRPAQPSTADEQMPLQSQHSRIDEETLNGPCTPSGNSPTSIREGQSPEPLNPSNESFANIDREGKNVISGPKEPVAAAKTTLQARDPADSMDKYTVAFLKAHADYSGLFFSCPGFMSHDCSFSVASLAQLFAHVKEKHPNLQQTCESPEIGMRFYCSFKLSEAIDLFKADMPRLGTIDPNPSRASPKADTPRLQIIDLDSSPASGHPDRKRKVYDLEEGCVRKRVHFTDEDTSGSSDESPYSQDYMLNSKLSAIPAEARKGKLTYLMRP